MRIGCVSGSPSRQLNSSTRGAPCVVDHHARVQEARCTACPRRPCRAIAGAITSRMIRACTVGVTTGAGEYAPMPPVFGPAVAVAQAACDPGSTRARSDVRAVGHHDEARLLAVEEFLDDHARAGVAERAADAASRRSRRAPRPRVIATTTPLPAASPSALTTIGAPRDVDVRMRGRGLGERRVRRGRNAVPRHERLREILRALEPRGGLRRPENPQARGA